MNRKIPTYIEMMGKSELIGFLEGYINSILSEGQEITNEMHDFVCLHQKIIAELSQQRVYKVSTIDATDVSCGVVKEYDTRHFGSLKAAKRELKRRFKEQCRHPFVAAPDEVQEIGVGDGIDPFLVQSIITNSDVPLNAPGRYKFYEVRMLRENQIIPIQFMLTSIDSAPAAIQQS